MRRLCRGGGAARSSSVSGDGRLCTRVAVGLLLASAEKALKRRKAPANARAAASCASAAAACPRSLRERLLAGPPRERGRARVSFTFNRMALTEATATRPSSLYLGQLRGRRDVAVPDVGLHGVAYEAISSAILGLTRPPLAARLLRSFSAGGARPRRCPPPPRGARRSTRRASGAPPPRADRSRRTRTGPS